MSGRRDDDQISKRSPRPGLSDQDLEIWRQVTQSVDPIDNSRNTVFSEMLEPQGLDAARAELKTSTASRTNGTPTPQSVRPREADSSRASELSGIDRRTQQRLIRGQVEIDARIDLHGHSQAEARMALHGFLIRARERGHRLVLVITGKGEAPFARHTLHSRDVHHDPGRHGVLRRALPQWVNETEFRELVSGFQPAHPKHGGGGAFYVRLRRARGPSR